MRVRSTPNAGPGDSLVNQIENHRRKRDEEQMENELEVPPSCKTRRQKMVGVHVIVFLIGLAIFLLEDLFLKLYI